jgi:hypothetical protein
VLAALAAALGVLVSLSQATAGVGGDALACFLAILFRPSRIGGTFATGRLARLLLTGILLLFAALPAYAGNPVPGRPPANGGPQVGTGASESSEGLAAGCTQPFCLYLPAVRAPATWVQTQDRQASRSFYLDQYLSSDGIAAGWTGNHSSCNAGSTSQEFGAAILRRINYFRAMAGVPSIPSFSDTYSSKARAAALMMSVNRQLSHNPPATWTCYTEAGAQGAGSSDLYLGVYGPAAISGYILDAGSGNYPVGHRRWILFPPTRQMGTGDIPPVGGYPASSALWVFDTFSPRPSTREAFVAWPPPGYVPYQVVFERWSFSYPEADFASATVTMMAGGAPLAVSQSPVVNGYGDNTLVWAPAGASGGGWPKPGQDMAYSVTLHKVMIGGRGQDFTYTVTIFDPGS